jgi:nucleoside-diphosphate-sugar epimerase
MRILLTGATGFIGVHLAKSLCTHHDVAALLRPQAKIERLAKVTSLRHLIWDGDKTSLPALLNDVRPEVIIHLAGYFVGEHKADDVVILIDSNIGFPTALLHAAVQAGCLHFINTGSYWQHYENASYAPVNLYAATKQAFATTLACCVADGMLQNALTLELTDTYGPGDLHPKLIPLLEQMAAGGNTLAMSPGQQFLDFVHIDDIVAGYVQALALLSAIPEHQAHAYALRSNQPIRLKDFITLYNEASPQPVNVEWGARPYRPREFMEPWTQGEVLPGWSPKIDLFDGLRALLRNNNSIHSTETAQRFSAST